jgi:LmbE family N-acetylglucosaminyl deacetylase
VKGRAGLLALALVGSVTVAAAHLAPSPGDRLLVLAPHPDDEVVGCAGLMQRAQAAGASVRVAFLTYGDANEMSFLRWRGHPVVEPKAVRAMGELRRDEAVAAARTLGLAPADLTFLGYPDFGTLVMLVDHWRDRPPYRSVLSRVTAVPYASARRPGAPYAGESVLRDLTDVLRHVRPTHVCVSHPADAHPDHRALYLYTRVALWDLAGVVDPVVLPYLVHHPDWPAPLGVDPQAALDPPPDLAERARWQRLGLDDGERAKKLAALRAHATQMRAGETLLRSFVRRNELFGDFPVLPLHAERVDAAFEAEEVAPPGGLTDAERARLLGLATRRIAREKSDLVVELSFSRMLGEATSVRVHLLGYRPDRPFAAMPKVRIEIGPIRHAAFDQQQRLPARAIAVERRGRRMIVRVPFATLGDPDRVLVGGRTTLADVPMAGLPWRVVTLAPERR